MDETIVYVAFGGIDFEGSWTLGVRSSLEAAQKLCDEHPEYDPDRDFHWKYDYQVIQEWVLDSDFTEARREHHRRMGEHLSQEWTSWIIQA